MLSASVRLIGEKKAGTFRRSMLSGTKFWEIIVANFATELILVVFQTFLTFVVLRIMTGKDPLGSILLCFVMFVLDGIFGMSLGKPIFASV